MAEPADEVATRELVADVMGTLHALPYTWSLLLSAVGDAAERTLPHAAATLATVAPDEDPPRTVDGFPERLRKVVPGVAAGVRDRSPADARLLLDSVEAHLHAAGREVVGVGVTAAIGTVTSVNASNGGVPKRPVGQARVGRRGLDVDRQTSRRHHGKPMQALCLYSQEVIDALRDEGHPIHEGATGENVTIAGLEWASLRPGVRLRIGSVLAELSAPTTPCDKNARWFVDGNYDRMHHDLHPGWSRWYAWVLEPGEITTGDPVEVEPGDA